MKKLFSLMLAIAMILTSMGTVVFAAEEGLVFDIGTGENCLTLEEALGKAEESDETEVTYNVYGKVTILTDSAYDVAGSKTKVNFVGKTEDAELFLDMNTGAGGYISAVNADVTFTGLIISKENGGEHYNNIGFLGVFWGVWSSKSVTYTECIFPEGAATFAPQNKFTGCIFSNDTEGEYNLWAYQAPHGATSDVVVEGCKFTGTRGIKTYHEGLESSMTNGTAPAVEVTGTSFDVTEKPAIALTYAKSVEIADNEYGDTGIYYTECATEVSGDDAAKIQACTTVDGDKVYFQSVELAEKAADESAEILLPTAAIGEKIFFSFEAALDAVQDGETVVVLKDITIDSGANAVNIVRDASFTLDLNGKEINANTTNSGIRVNINNENVGKPAEVTVKNGTINAGKSAYCAVIASGKDEEVQLTVNIEDVTMTNCHNYGFNVKAFAYATVNVKDGTKITSTDGQGGVYAQNGSVVNVYDGVEIVQKDSATTYMGANLGVSGTGILNVYGGTFISDKYNANVMSSGGTLNIYDGTFTSDQFGVHVDSWDSNIAAPSVANIYGGTFTAPTAVWTGANAGEEYSATANITGGIFNGAIDASYGGAESDITVAGGTFDTDVKQYLENGFYAPENNGIYEVAVAPATVVDSAKIDNVTITLDDLHLHESVDVTADAHYEVVAVPAAEESVAEVVDIVSDETKTVVAYDIHVEKDGEEYSAVTNQQVTIDLPEVATSAEVYHKADNKEYVEIQDVKLIANGTQVTFTAPSFSDYAVVYEAADSSAVKATEIEIKLAETSEQGVYDIVAASTDSTKFIHQLSTAKLTFVNTSADKYGKTMGYTITGKDIYTYTDEGNGTYTFYAKDGAAMTKTKTEVTIGQVKFEGYGTINFKVDSVKDNNVITKTVLGNVEDTFSAANNNLIVDTDAELKNVSLTPEMADLTLVVDMAHIVQNNDADTQKMQIKIDGLELDAPIIIDLGEDYDYEACDNAATETEKEHSAYSVKVADQLIKGFTYTVTISGDGYRTADYTIRMDGKKTLKFWNNVMSSNIEMVEGDGKGTTKNFLAGDIYEDGVINVYDLSAVVSYFGEDVAANADNYTQYDLNRNGVIDGLDISILLNSWGE